MNTSNGVKPGSGPRPAIPLTWAVVVAGLLFSIVAVPGAVPLLAASVPPQSSSNPSSSKHDYALIYITVWGEDNRPVAGVPVSIRRSGDKKPKWQLVSDHQGECAQRVPAGTRDYVVEAEIKTAKGKAKPQTTVHIDNDERRDVGLHLTKQEIQQK